MAKNDKSQRKTIEEVRAATRADIRRIAAGDKTTLSVSGSRTRRKSYLDRLTGLVNSMSIVPQ